MALGMGFNFKSSKDKRVDDLQGISCKIVSVSLSRESKHTIVYWQEVPAHVLHICWVCSLVDLSNCSFFDGCAWLYPMDVCDRVGCHSNLGNLALILALKVETYRAIPLYLATLYKGYTIL